jgi:ligand-binding SRPBCC domain-containing protein
MAHFEYSSIIKAPRLKVFDTITNFNNFPKIMTPFDVKLVVLPEKMAKNSKYKFRISRWGISFLWEHQVEVLDVGAVFRDFQTAGPFSYWIHTRKLEDHGDETLLTEIIDYDLPLGIFGKLAEDLVLQREFDGIFKARHNEIAKVSSHG